MSNVTLRIDDSCYTIVLPHSDSDLIQNYIATSNEPFEIEMLRDMAARLNKGDLVLDVGANIGNHTLYLACTKGCRVHAFEPNMELCNGLENSIKINNLETQVTIHSVGVSDSPGTANFGNINPESLGEQTLEMAGDKGSIKLVKLDDIQWDDDIKMMKIDVEGMEFKVLSGAENIIKKYRPIIYVESWNLSELKKITLFLKKNGYHYCRTFDAGPTNLFVFNPSLPHQPYPLSLISAPLVYKKRWVIGWATPLGLVPVIRSVYGFLKRFGLSK